MKIKIIYSGGSNSLKDLKDELYINLLGLRYQVLNSEDFLQSFEMLKEQLYFYIINNEINIDHNKFNYNVKLNDLHNEEYLYKNIINNDYINNFKNLLYNNYNLILNSDKNEIIKSYQQLYFDIDNLLEDFKKYYIKKRENKITNSINELLKSKKLKFKKSDILNGEFLKNFKPEIDTNLQIINSINDIHKKIYLKYFIKVENPKDITKENLDSKFIDIFKEDEPTKKKKKKNESTEDIKKREDKNNFNKFLEELININQFDNFSYQNLINRDNFIELKFIFLNFFNKEKMLYNDFLNNYQNQETDYKNRYIGQIKNIFGDGITNIEKNLIYYLKVFLNFDNINNIKILEEDNFLDTLKTFYTKINPDINEYRVLKEFERIINLTLILLLKGYEVEEVNSILDHLKKIINNHGVDIDIKKVINKNLKNILNFISEYDLSLIKEKLNNNNKFNIEKQNTYFNFSKILNLKNSFDYKSDNNILIIIEISKFIFYINSIIKSNDEKKLIINKEIIEEENEIIEDENEILEESKGIENENEEEQKDNEKEDKLYIKLNNEEFENKYNINMNYLIDEDKNLLSYRVIKKLEENDYDLFYNLPFFSEINKDNNLIKFYNEKNLFKKYEFNEEASKVILDNINLDNLIELFFINDLDKLNKIIFFFI